MEFQSYITYNEYVALGGTVSEDAFPILERKAQRYLDALTYNRIPELDTIPDVVKEVLTEFITRLNNFSNQSTEGEIIKQYSNGVESMTFSRLGESELRSNLRKLAIDWLPTYLTYKGVNFDVRRYLQSDGNNS